MLYFIYVKWEFYSRLCLDNICKEGTVKKKYFDISQLCYWW